MSKSKEKPEPKFLGDMFGNVVIDLDSVMVKGYADGSVALQIPGRNEFTVFRSPNRPSGHTIAWAPAVIKGIFENAAFTLNGLRIETRPGGFTARTDDGKLVADWPPQNTGLSQKTDLLIEETQPQPEPQPIFSTLGIPARRPGEYQSDGGNEENISWPLGGPRPPIA